MFRSRGSSSNSEHLSLYEQFSQYNSDHVNNNASDSVVPKKGRKFGEFIDTYDWVQCDSKSDPGKVYFFNMRSKCTTWARPVSDDVPLQHFIHEARLCDSISDSDDPLMIVSEYEGENDKAHMRYCALSFDDMHEENIVDAKGQVFQKLYYGIHTRDESCFEYTDEDSDAAREVSIVNNQTLPTSKDMAEESSQISEANIVSIEMSEQNSECSFSMADFLEIKLEVASQPLKIKPLKNNIYDTSSSELEEAYEQDRCYGIPRLREIQSTDLLSSKRRKKKKQLKNPVNEKKRILKRQPTIRTMYGTTTINYDSDYECQLDKPIPSHIKQTNLSDSSESTSIWPRNKKAEENLNNVLNVYRIPLSKIPVINLSESSSSSSSSSDCSSSSSDCSSSSSDSSSSSSDSGSSSSSSSSTFNSSTTS